MNETKRIYRRRTLEELNVLDDFLMNAAASDPETLAKRNRFYQGKIDSRYLAGGEKSFSQLPNLFVIMILPFDPFGQDHMVYRVRNKFEEFPDLDYPDGLRYIYFNTRGTKGGSPAVRELLDYLLDSTEENAKSETLQTLHRHIRRVKILPEVREEYMLWEEKIAYERKEAAEEASIGLTVKHLLSLLNHFGAVPDELRRKIASEEDPDTLDRWFHLAVQCGSVQEFEKRMQA